MRAKVAEFREAAPPRPHLVAQSGFPSADAKGGRSASGPRGNPTPGARGAPSADELGRRLALILARIDATKYYPETARERGAQGTTYVRFRLRPDGQPAFVRVHRSSGNALLDKASVLTVQQAAPFPYVTQVLTVPIKYALKE